MNLLLVRHGLPEATAPAEGVPDPDLSATGRDQAARAAAWLAGERIDVVLSSPLRRAILTAEPTAAAHGLPVIVEPGVREIHFGEDSYVPVEQLTAGSAQVALYRAVMADESHDLIVSFRAQVRDALADIVRRYADLTVLVACHGGVINAALAEALEVRRTFAFDIGYASITRLRSTRSGSLRVSSVNEEGHLRTSP
jgi:2,3-bisphosphoglycerate-dependent phosphoglycerate mutase